MTELPANGKGPFSASVLTNLVRAVLVGGLVGALSDRVFARIVRDFESPSLLFSLSEAAFAWWVLLFGYGPLALAHTGLLVWTNKRIQNIPPVAIRIATAPALAFLIFAAFHIPWWGLGFLNFVLFWPFLMGATVYGVIAKQPVNTPSNGSGGGASRPSDVPGDHLTSEKSGDAKAPSDRGKV